ncbi:gp189 [Synechococcus phage S-CBM2]|nr:gp189 [Synechococcus phage S-CBM2]
MRFDILNEENHLFFAIQNYNNPQAVTCDDFEDDMKRFKYLKRLIRKYEKSGVLRTHLILNHIIVLYNVFGEAATPLLFFKIEKKHWSILKTFILFIDRLTEHDLINISIDPIVYKELKGV